MMFETCSEKRHFFNRAYDLGFDGKCDCKKKKMSKKKYKEFIESLEAKVDKLEDE